MLNPFFIMYPNLMLVMYGLYITTIKLPLGVVKSGYSIVKYFTNHENNAPVFYQEDFLNHDKDEDLVI